MVTATNITGVEHESVVVNQLKVARSPLRDCKPSLLDGSRNLKNSNEIAAQKSHLKELFYSLKHENHNDTTIFSLLYSKINNVNSQLLTMELTKLNTTRFVNVCTLKKFACIKGRVSGFPDNRVNYFRNPANLDDSLLKPTMSIDTNDKSSPSYNSKLITCKVDTNSPEDKFACFQSLKSINKLEVLLKETPILSYNIPACICTYAQSYRCYHCQKVVEEFYPCQTCDICVFCDIDCYLFALDLYHRWECFALQRHMFSTNQMMAMRLMLMGMQTDIFNQKVVRKTTWLKYHSNSSYDRVMAAHRDYIQDKQLRANYRTIHFADKIGGYGKYYDQVAKYYELRKLSVNWDEMADIDIIILDVFRMLGYFARSTDLFQHWYKCPWRPDHVTITDLQMYAGGMLLRHYGEVLCHALALPNLAMRPDQLEEIEDGTTFVLGPNLGRFQHSCEPNAACFLYNNEVIVRTFTDIEQNKKVLINYFGLENNIQRQLQKELIQNMYFSCNCSKCNTMDCEDALGLTAFKCPLCEESLYGDVDQLELQCFSCNALHCMKPFHDKEIEIKAILDKATKVTEFRRAEKICNEIFKPYNPQYDQIYRNLQKIYVKIRDPVNTKFYFTKYLEYTAHNSPSVLTKVTAKLNFYFLRYFLDMCRCEHFYDAAIMNLIIQGLLNVRLVYVFYYNLEQIAIVTDLISSINPLLCTQNLRVNSPQGEEPIPHNAKDKNKSKTVVDVEQK